MKKVMVRFWNSYNENIEVNGKYNHYFPTFEEACAGAQNMIEEAYRLGAESCDIDNVFYRIINDEDEE